MRKKLLDVLRGILMLYIVFVIHGLFWLSLIPSWASSWLLFEMPAIFIIAGYAYYLYESTALTTPLSVKTYCKFLGSRLTRILVPYIVYATFCVILVYMISHFNNQGVSGYGLNALLIAWLNPIDHGGELSFSTLNWHLWFVPIFLIVTAAMPIMTRFKPLKNPRFLLVLLAVLISEFLLSQTHFVGEWFIKQAAFYLAFSLFGYYMGFAADYCGQIKYSWIFVFSGSMLVLIGILHGNLSVLNMQANKFPPNYIFFLFSCLWISFFLGVFFKFPKIAVKLEEFQDASWLRPFLSAGYSIYLWQGLGYTAAIYTGKVFNFPILMVWGLALVFSVCFGLIAVPAERIRLQFSRKELIRFLNRSCKSDAGKI